MVSRFSKSFLFIILALFFFGTLTLFHAPSRAYLNPWTGDVFGEGGVEKDLHAYPDAPVNGAHGGVIMSKLGNATAKAELGRATWKLLHTMTLRYPESPTQDERDALSNYFHLTSRLYPCGECAAEFQQLLKEFPPQTSARRAAATWLCVIHNKVNARLHKPEFDCANLDATYDCGCGDDPVDAPSLDSGGPDPMDLERDPTKDEITGFLVRSHGWCWECYSTRKLDSIEGLESCYTNTIVYLRFCSSGKITKKLCPSLGLPNTH